jgi:hypothetical protein
VILTLEKINTFFYSIAIYKYGVTDMKDTRTGMSTNIHTQLVSRRDWSYCCFIHPSALNSSKKKIERATEKDVLLLNQRIFVITNAVYYSIYKLMPPKLIHLKHKSHGNHSRNFSSEINDYHNNQQIDDTNEHRDTIEPLESVKTDVTSEEQQHRTRRRSSLQILDIKFIHTLSNQIDNQSNDRINASEDLCECQALTIFFFFRFFSISHRTLKYIYNSNIYKKEKKKRQQRRKLCRSRFSIRRKGRQRHQHLLHHRLSLLIFFFFVCGYVLLLLTYLSPYQKKIFFFD